MTENTILPAVDLENNVEKRKKALIDFDDYCKKLREAYDRKHDEFLWYVSTINHIRDQLQLLTETHHNFKLPNRQKLFDLLDNLLKEGTKLPADKRKKLEELKEKQRQMIIETKRDLKNSTKKLQELNPLAVELDKELVKHIPDYRGSTAVGGASENNNSFEMINSVEAKRRSAPVETQRKIIKEEKKVKSLPDDFGNVATPEMEKPSGGVEPVAPSSKKPSGEVAPVPTSPEKPSGKVAPVPTSVKRTSQRTKFTPEAGVGPGISYRPVLSPGSFKMAPIPHPMRHKIRIHQGRMDNLAGKLDDYIVLCDDYEKKYDKKHGEIIELFEMLKKINKMIQTLNSDIYADVKGDISKYSELLKIVTDLDNTETIRTGLKKQIVEQNDYLKEAKKVTKELLAEAEKFRKDPSSYTPPEHTPMVPRVDTSGRGDIRMTYFDRPYSPGPYKSSTPIVPGYLVDEKGNLISNPSGYHQSPGLTHPFGKPQTPNPEYPFGLPLPLQGSYMNVEAQPAGATYLEVENPSGQPGADYLEVGNPSGQPGADYLQIGTQGTTAPGKLGTNYLQIGNTTEPVYAVAQETPSYNSAPKEAVLAKPASYQDVPQNSGEYKTAESGEVTYETIPEELGGKTKSNVPPPLPPPNPGQIEPAPTVSIKKKKKKKRNKGKGKGKGDTPLLESNLSFAELALKAKSGITGKKTKTQKGGGRKIGTLKFCCSKNRTKKNSYIGEIMDSNGKRIKLRTKSKRINELKKLKNKQVTYTEQNGYAVDVKEQEQYNNAFPALNMKTKSKTKRKGPSGTEKINTKKRMRPVGALPATRR